MQIEEWNWNLIFTNHNPVIEAKHEYKIRVGTHCFRSAKGEGYYKPQRYG